MPQNRIIDIKRVESSPTEPVTPTEAKKHLLVDFSDDDTYITALITQARMMIEEYCAISIVSKTITLIADLYMEREIPYGPVIAIISVQTRAGTQGSGPATYESATTDWQTDGEEFMTFNPNAFGCSYSPTVPFTGRLDPAPDYRWKIVYTAGYTTVPDGLKLAVLNQIAFLYENRGNENKGICESAQAYAFPYKRMLWF